MEANSQLPLLYVDSVADKKFQKFDEDNPKVLEELVKMTRELVAQGHNKVGMQMLFEVIRWRTMMRTTDEDYKINNNYASRYARKLMDEYPEFRGMFNLRELKS
jgi:hypothetical protein